jgi:hypothetical protein
MKRYVLAAVLAVSVFGATAIIGNTAEAARIRASIAFAGGDASATGVITPNAGQEVSFAVTAAVSKESDLYSLWVANKCFSGSSLISAEYQPVHSTVASGFTIPAAATSCTAYAWQFPNSETPLRGASMTYSVSQ